MQTIDRLINNELVNLPKYNLPEQTRVFESQKTRVLPQ
jgi:hypothetical protein